ncbi:MAG TPA: histidine phosphatase family protein [Caulobacteraceae bacterium]|jgi:2,3-bisphosphoglycerate-dependent phosphoglycerate mutase|nr:histidine phosphatase family protein [Caulobacteraceae bacterium]
MTTLILVRHAQSAPSPDLPEPVFPLSEKGRQQAIDLAPVLAELGVDALGASPYQRAIDTLQPYADATGLPIAIDPDLRECSLGGWLTEVSDVEAAIRRMHAEPDYCLEGGETSRSTRARFLAALGRLVGAHPGRTLAVASHGAILSHFIAPRAPGPLPDLFWRQIRNPHLFVFDVSAGGDYVWRGERTLDGGPGITAAA